jgi:hypothetical protein
MLLGMGGLPFRLIQGSGALLLGLLAACGGRSTTLGPDADGTRAGSNQPTSGSTGSPSTGAGATGAKGSVEPTGSGAGGNGGTPAGGGAAAAAATGGTAAGGVSGAAAAPGTASGGAPQGGASGIPPSAHESCNQYCRLTAAGACNDSGLTINQCLQSCVSELGAESPQCQSKAFSLLDCMAAVYQSSSNCEQVNELTNQRCAGSFDAYESCRNSPLEPPPAPPPAPVCSSSGSSSTGSCTLKVQCTNRASYSVACYQTSPEQSTCTCNADFADGAGSGASFGLNEDATFACYDSLAACGFPDLGLK